MYRPGHVGIGFLFTLPLIVLTSLNNTPIYSLPLIILFSIVTVHPDIDNDLEDLTRRANKIPLIKRIIPIIEHRKSFTHDVKYSVLVGIILATPAFFLIDYKSSIVLFYIGCVGVLAHILGDILNPSGVNVLGKNRSLNFCYSKSLLWNTAFLIIGAISILITSFFFNSIIYSTGGIIGSLILLNIKNFYLYGYYR